MTAIIYWSGTGNTSAMAEAIQEGMQQGGAQVTLLSVDQADAGMIEQYEKIAFGCPSMGDEVLEEYEFAPFFSSVEGKLSGKKVALFGSYGWGDGQWMREWAERVKGTGANLYDEGLIMQETPEKDACVSYGKAFAAF